VGAQEELLLIYILEVKIFILLVFTLFLWRKVGMRQY